jgi:broad specificity phosphatase PhoE
VADIPLPIPNQLKVRGGLLNQLITAVLLRLPNRFEQSVRAFFDNPNELVYGRETAAQAEQGFTQAVEAVTQTHPTGDVAIVAHGTVITLFVTRHNPMPAFDLWQRMSLPSYIVLTLPAYEMVGDVRCLDRT